MPAFLIGLLLAPIWNLPVLTIDPVESQKQIYLQELHLCENRDNLPRWIDSNGCYSYSKYAWQMSSWLNFKDEGATKDNISDPAMQDKITEYALDHGQFWRWKTCSGKLKAKGITY